MSYWKRNPLDYCLTAILHPAFRSLRGAAWTLERNMLPCETLGPWCFFLMGGKFFFFFFHGSTEYCITSNDSTKRPLNFSAPHGLLLGKCTISSFATRENITSWLVVLDRAADLEWPCSLGWPYPHLYFRVLTHIVTFGASGAGAARTTSSTPFKFLDFRGACAPRRPPLQKESK